MPQHEAIAAGRAAVITGAASGIGLAAAERFASLGMKVCLADIDAAALERAAAERRAASPAMRRRHRRADRRLRLAAMVERLRERAYAAFGDVAILMNNAGREGGGQLLGDPGRWRRDIETNLFGVVNGIQAFAPAMIAAGGPGAIISTGSKQGITTPPGDTAYNVSKAGVKVATEALAHELRSDRGLPHQRASPDPGLHLHRPHAEARQREARRRLDARAGDRLPARGDWPGRLLYPLPRQRRDAARWTRSASAGRRGHHREPAGPVALASRL